MWLSLSQNAFTIYVPLEFIIPIFNVCSLPFLSNGQEVCGNQALEVCLSATGLEVQLLPIGAVLIIWCHLIWLVALVITLVGSLESQVVLKPENRESLLAQAGLAAAPALGT